MAGLKVCSRPGCPNLTPSGRCHPCTRTADLARGTATQRGYNRDHRAFREAVLTRDPFCTVRHPGCTRRSTVADHWPTSRRDLETAGEDPNDPQHGRGTCHNCHSRETAVHQPGGWNR